MTRVTNSVESPSATIRPERRDDMELFIQGVAADLANIKQFYPISFSQARLQRLEEYMEQKSAELGHIPFDQLCQEGQVDYVLARNFLTRKSRENAMQSSRTQEMKDYLDVWAPSLVELCQWRQQVVKFQGQTASARMSDAVEVINDLSKSFHREMKLPQAMKEKVVQDRASHAVTELQRWLSEMVLFYQDYDPVMTWWIAKPWELLSKAMTDFASLLRERAGNGENSTSGDIIGQPLGRHALLQEIEAECIPYSPEELIEIGEKELVWCEAELKKASKALGYDDPKDALEHTRNTFIEPGEQIHMVRELADEAVAYVVDRDMITVPRIANECWRTVMMSPKRQKINPFFTGGNEITVSYPTRDMCHEEKMMSMRGNNPPFSRATVQHELVPGHHLQFYYMDRYRPHRKLFETPFWIEGWALYWEFILWDRGFPAQVGQKYATNEAENRIGMLFWRMHRCARIIFSLKFHLGQMSPQQCIDILVDRVGHERTTAEGEVRRSFNGDYSPLYQAGYMLGALQLYELRRELLQPCSGWTEKAFHDRVMQENILPIELLRALLLRKPLSPDWQSQWRFYDLKASA